MIWEIKSWRQISVVFAIVEWVAAERSTRIKQFLDWKLQQQKSRVPTDHSPEKNCRNIQSDFLQSRVWILMLQTEFNSYLLLLLDGYTVPGSINNDKVDCNWSLMTSSNPRYWDESKVYNSNIPFGQQLIKTQGIVHHVFMMIYSRASLHNWRSSFELFLFLA